MAVAAQCATSVARVFRVNATNASVPMSLPQRWWRRLEDRLDFLSPYLNPLRHLGSIAMLMLWVLLASGVYLYAVIDTSVSGSYASIDRLSRDQWWLGGVLRSLHRYAADVLVLCTLLHLLREWVLGRFRGLRRVAWWTGTAMLPLLMVSAIGGFWLNWDQLGQFSATATAEWLDWWPLFATPLTRNFLGASSISDRLFSLFVFVHLGVPLLMLFGCWFHVRKLALAAVWPPRVLSGVMVSMLLLIALLAPVISHAPADLARMPEALAFDWVLLVVHPLVAATSATTVWLSLLSVLALLLVLPFWPTSTPPAVAEVHPRHCSGCRRCVDDCPYDAITMTAHPQRSGYALAVVDASACASCGICVGSCPSSTPFRSMAQLVTGIDMPQQPIDTLRRTLRERLQAMPPGNRWVVFGCDHGAAVRDLEADNVATFSLICIGQLPPAFVEYALRDGADAVLISGCPASGCAFRLGQRWTEDRLAGVRDPKLRQTVPASRWTTIWAGAGELPQVADALHALQRRAAPEKIPP